MQKCLNIILFSIIISSYIQCMDIKNKSPKFHLGVLITVVTQKVMYLKTRDLLDLNQLIDYLTEKKLYTHTDYYYGMLETDTILQQQFPGFKETATGIVSTRLEKINNKKLPDSERKKEIIEIITSIGQEYFKIPKDVDVCDDQYFIQLNKVKSTK